MIFVLYRYDNTIADDGKKLEKELNDKGPGEAYYIKCDVTIEEDIKVIKHSVAWPVAWELDCLGQALGCPWALLLSIALKLHVSLPTDYMCPHLKLLITI